MKRPQANPFSSIKWGKFNVGDLAYGRTTSAGQQEVLVAYTKSKEANNELFIFRKEEGHPLIWVTSA